MSSVVISGDTSGSVTLQAPATAGSTTINLPTVSGGSFIVSDSSGNVGIGTTSPASKLDVNGAIRSTSGTTLLVTSVTGGIPYIQGYDGTTSANNQLAFYTGSAERMRIDSSGYVTNAVNGLGNGIVQAQQYYRLNSVRVGSDVNTAQSMFGVGVTLIGSTQYEFEVNALLIKSAGTTLHSISFGFGGTATLNNISYTSVAQTAVGVTVGNAAIYGYTTAAASQITQATSTAAIVAPIIIKGTVSINAGGTFIPQYTLSAAPGGAYTTQIGSYVKIAPLAASGANVSIGTWA